MNENEKRYIILKNEQGKLEKRRVLIIYQTSNIEKDYLIYYDDTVENPSDYFVISYDSNTDLKNINYNLTEEELSYANKVFETLKENGDE